MPTCRNSVHRGAVFYRPFVRGDEKMNKKIITACAAALLMAACARRVARLSPRQPEDGPFGIRIRRSVEHRSRDADPIPGSRHHRHRGNRPLCHRAGRRRAPRPRELGRIIHLHRCVRHTYLSADHLHQRYGSPFLPEAA